MNLFRWVARFPAYFTCAMFGTLFARLISRNLTVVLALTGFVVGFIAVCVGGFVAPSHKTVTVIVLAVFNGLWAIAYARRNALATGIRVDYLFVWCALGGMVAAFNF